MKEIAFLSLFPILIFASIWDLKFKKIPNALILLGLVAGVGVSTYQNGFTGLWQSILAILLTFFAFILIWGVMAAGDIKLLMVISAFYGAVVTIKVGYISLLVAGLIFMLLFPKKIKKLADAFVYFLFYKIPIQPVSKAKSIAFSPFILISFLFFYFIWRG